MARKHSALDRCAIPPEDLDLFVACGEVLLRDETKPFGSRGKRPYFLRELWNAQAPILQTYATPEGLNWEDFELQGEEGRARLATRARDTLERMQRKGSPIAGPHGFGRLSPAAFAVVAGLSACWIFKGCGAGFEELYPIFDLCCRHPGEFRKVLDELEDLCHYRVLRWSWEKHQPMQSSTIVLSEGAIRFLGLPFPSTPKKEEGDDEEEDRPASRRRSEEEAEPFATVKEGALKLEDVVLPPEPREELAFLAASIRQGAAPFPAALFLGPPGTGKTFAARALAGETGRPLVLGEIPRLRIKWVGDTEKALKQIFDFAEKERAILFFDEADALLMDRNMAYHSWELSEVNTLLSLLDRQTVPVVLCTNFVQYMDSALHRRIQSRIEFPFPAAAERQEIWRRELERQGLQGTFDLPRLAEVPITGGLIRNAVQRAVRRRVVSGNDLTFTTEELVRLAEGERPKLGVALERRVTGFGGACAWSGPEKRREEEANWGGC
jgi:hypothetical protein